MSRTTTRGLTGLLLALLVSCAKPPPPPPKPSLPTLPLTFGPLRPSQPVHHELVFTPGQTYEEGLELHFVLLDAEGEVLHRGKLALGPIFEGKGALVAGRPHVRRLRKPADQLKVIGPRPRSVRDPDDFDFERIARARLLHLFRCRRLQREWKLGMPVPEGVKDIRPGDIIERNVCDRQRLIRDRQLEKSFAHRRRPDGERAWIEVRIAFNRDFPKGVSFALELRDEKGRRVDPRCHLAVQQPRVFSGEAVEYRIDFAGRSAVANFARTRALSYRELVAHGGGVREPGMKQLCEDGS